MAVSEDRLRCIVDNLFVFVGLLDAEGRMIEVNATPLQAAGLARDDVLGRCFQDCAWWTHDAAVVERVRLTVGRALRGETVRCDETIRVADDGRMVIDFQLAPLRDSCGAITSVVASGVNITPRLLAVAEAESQRARLDALLDAAPAGIVMCHTSGRLLRTNRVFLDIWGAMAQHMDTGSDPASWSGWWADGSACHGQPLAPGDWPLAQVLSSGQAQIGEVIEIAPFDTLGWAPMGRRVIHLSASPVLDASGWPAAWRCRWTSPSAWPSNACCAKPTARRTSSSPRSRTNGATRWRPFAPVPRSSACAARPTRTWHAVVTWCCARASTWSACSTPRACAWAR